MTVQASEGPLRRVLSLEVGAASQLWPTRLGDSGRPLPTLDPFLKRSGRDPDSAPDSDWLYLAFRNHSADGDAADRKLAGDIIDG